MEIDAAFEKETANKKTLTDRLQELNDLIDGKKNELSILNNKLSKASTEPARICRQADATEKAVDTMTEQFKSLKRKIDYANNELEKTKVKRESTEKLKLSILEKNEIHRLTIEKRERDVASVLKSLEEERALLHDNVTKKMELNLKKKEMDAEYRHLNDRLNFMKKDYEAAKRMYKKKRGKADAIRSLVPTLMEQQNDEEHNVALYKADRDEIRKRNEKLKEDVDVLLAHFLEQEGIEKSKKDVSSLLFFM